MDKKTAYTAMLQRLMPRGAAWTREPDAALTKILAIMAAPLARVDDRAADLLNEADPRTTLELLDDWEETAGLPDTCSNIATTLQERHAALLDKVTRKGGQDKAFFIALADRLGYEIEIEEYKPFICGASRCGDGLNGGPEIRYVWRAHVLHARITYFRTGGSSCGDKLGSIQRASDLECLFNQLKPAHTHLYVSYEGV